MAEDSEEEMPRRKKKGKGLSGKKIAILLSLLLIFCLGAAVQHYFIEPLVNENVQNYSACLSQKNVSEQRFFECARQLEDTNNAERACEYQLNQCLNRQ